uniref:CRIB domain-containing protein n=1 Tax=Oryza meridionalis TaxID=40149 RepID=A0A0E0D9J5_9ORYZ
MKERRGSAGVFPFSIGCMSQSAVDVADPHDKKSTTTTQNDPSSSSASAVAMAAAAQSAEEEGSGEKVKGATAAAAVASSGIVATGVQRLIKGIKNLSQIFAMYDDEEEDEEEREMVIGYPTDVQHVGHIGWDGMNKVGGMVNAFSLPSSLSLRQLEMAMEAAHA